MSQCPNCQSKAAPLLCGVCGEWCAVHLPDNRTAVPCCQECWGKMSPALRLQTISQAKQVQSWDDIASMMNGFLEARAAEMAAEIRSRRNRMDNN